jgi:hypothetical protein
VLTAQCRVRGVVTTILGLIVPALALWVNVRIKLSDHRRNFQPVHVQSVGPRRIRYSRHIGSAKIGMAYLLLLALGKIGIGRIGTESTARTLLRGSSFLLARRMLLSVILVVILVGRTLLVGG